MTLVQRMLKEVQNQRLILQFHDALSKLSEVERRSELPTNKIELIPFELWSPRSEENLVLRIKGSPDDLADRALATLLLLKADMDTERFKRIDTNARRALQRSMCESIDVSTSVKNQVRLTAERSAPDRKRFNSMDQIVEKGMKQLGPLGVVQAFEQANLEKDPLPHLMEALAEVSPLPRIGAKLDDASKRYLEHHPEEVMGSPEWNKVIESKGNVDPKDLSSVFSLLMAFVLKEPGLTISDYNNKRNEVTRIHRNIGIKREVAPSTTAVEFSIIKRYGWVNVKDNRVYPERGLKISRKT